MLINPMLPYIPPYRPLSNITPFTYRDGLTYADELHNLKKWLNEVIEFVNNNFGELGEKFSAEVDKLIDSVNTIITTQTELVDQSIASNEASVDAKISDITAFVNAAVQSIIEDGIQVQDPVVAGILEDPNSESSAVLSAAIADRTIAVSAEIPKTYGAVVSNGAVELPTIHRHNAFPGLGRMSDGRWIATWRGAWDHEFTKDGVLVFSRSADGITWDAPTVISTNTAALGEVRDPSLTVTASGEVLIVLYARTVERSFLIRSSDNGDSWSQPEELPFPAGGAFVCAPIQILPSGRWIVAAYVDWTTTAKTVVMRSDDNGATWLHVTLTPINPQAGFLEPNIISLGGNNLLMLMRAATGQHIYRTASSNGGETWGPVTTAFYGTNNPHMIRWKSGAITVTYRHPTHGGFMLRSSFNNGTSWTRPFHVAQSLTFMGNATAVELDETPGQALILWCSEDDGPCSIATSTLSESGGISRFGPIAHPAFEATNAKIPDRIWVPAHDLSPVAGSPIMGQVSTNPGYLLDAAGQEAVATILTVPDEWRRFNVVAWFASTDTALGDVVWSASHSQFQEDGTLTTGTFVNGPVVTFLDGVAGDIRSTTILSNLTPDERALWHFRVIRNGANAADTYAADILLLGIELRRTR